MSIDVTVSQAAAALVSVTSSPVTVTIQEADTTRPTCAITMSSYDLGIGETATVTLTFSKRPLDFTAADITAPNGALSGLAVSADPRVYTATFTPTDNTNAPTNVITLGVGWSDIFGNYPASETTSSNYVVATFVLYETPSYANAGGTGDRRSIITITATAGLMNDDNLTTRQALINGSMSGEVWFSGVAAAGMAVTFDFGHMVLINEAKWYQDQIASQGTWKFQGSNNGTDWADIGANFALGSPATQTITTLSANVTPYRYYQMIGVSGSASTTPYTVEIEFKIGNPQ